MSGKFLKNVGWMGGTELVIRVSRLLVVVVLGRLLSPHDYGLAAIVLTINDFVDVLTRNGITAKLIQAPKADLPKLCNTAYWLTWIVAALLFVIQCVAGVAAGWIYSDRALVLPICALALIYPMLPLAQVRSALIQRENRLEVSALSVSLQVVVNAVLTVIFAFLGWGMWAIVAPKVLVVPIWVAVNRANHTWKAPRTFDLSGWQAIAFYCLSLIASESTQAIAFKKGQSRRLPTARTGGHLSARSPENQRSPLANELPRAQAFQLAIAQHIQKRTSAPCGC